MPKFTKIVTGDKSVAANNGAFVIALCDDGTPALVLVGTPDSRESMELWADNLLDLLNTDRLQIVDSVELVHHNTH